MLGPKNHNKPILYADIEKMKFNRVLFDENSSVWKLLDEYYANCMIDLATHKKRFIIERINRCDIF